MEELGHGAKLNCMQSPLSPEHLYAFSPVNLALKPVSSYYLFPLSLHGLPVPQDSAPTTQTSQIHTLAQSPI